MSWIRGRAHLGWVVQRQLADVRHHVVGGELVGDRHRVAAARRELVALLGAQHGARVKIGKDAHAQPAVLIVGDAPAIVELGCGVRERLKWDLVVLLDKVAQLPLADVQVALVEDIRHLCARAHATRRERRDSPRPDVCTSRDSSLCESQPRKRAAARRSHIPSERAKLAPLLDDRVEEGEREVELAQLLGARAARKVVVGQAEVRADQVGAQALGRPVHVSRGEWVTVRVPKKRYPQRGGCAWWVRVARRPRALLGHLDALLQHGDGEVARRLRGEPQPEGRLDRAARRRVGRHALADALEVLHPRRREVRVLQHRPRADAHPLLHHPLGDRALPLAERHGRHHVGAPARARKLVDDGDRVGAGGEDEDERR
eukprot:1365106-Prymnesium_polylepis.2